MQKLPSEEDLGINENMINELLKELRLKEVQLLFSIPRVSTTSSKNSSRDSLSLLQLCREVA